MHTESTESKTKKKYIGEFVVVQEAQTSILGARSVQCPQWFLAFRTGYSISGAYDVWYPFGRYCWKRLPFGVSPGPEIFQMRIHQLLEGLPGVFVIADDISLQERGLVLL